MSKHLRTKEQEWSGLTAATGDSDEAAGYRRTVTELVLAIRQRGFALSATEELLVEQWRREGTPLDALCRAILHGAERAQSGGEGGNRPPRATAWTLSYLAPAIRERLSVEAASVFRGAEPPPCSDLPEAALGAELLHLADALCRVGGPEFVRAACDAARQMVEALARDASAGELGRASAGFALRAVEESMARSLWRGLSASERAIVQEIAEPRGGSGTWVNQHERWARISRAIAWFSARFAIPRLVLTEEASTHDERCT